MKKIILFAAIAMAACVGRAEYLYWQIGDSVTDTTKFNAVALYGTKDGSNYSLVDGYYSADLTKTYESDIGNAGTYKNFYIEAANYANGSYTPVDQSTSVTYESLAGNIHSSMQTISSVTAYTGAQYKSVPEPTSGLMLLMGMALVALKRKRA